MNTSMALGLTLAVTCGPQALVPPPPSLEAIHVFSVLVFCLTLVLGTAGNAMVLYVAGRMMRASVNTAWFLGLAMADLAFCLLLPAQVVYLLLHFHWPFGRALCKAVAYLQQLALLWSSFTVALISLDRCLSVTRPVWSLNHRRPSLARRLCALACVAAAILATPILLYRSTLARPDGRVICYMSYLLPSEQALHEQALSNSSALGAFWREFGPSIHARARAYTLALALLGFLLPIVVMVAAYALLGLRVRAHGRPGRSKPFRVMGAIVGAFVFCLLPLQVFKMVELARQAYPGLGKVLRLGLPLATNLAFVNSCLNPILYLAVGRGFRMRRLFTEALETAMADDSATGQGAATRETRSLSLHRESSA